MVRLLQTTTRSYQNISISCRFDKDLSNGLWKLLQHLNSSVVELKIKTTQQESTHPFVLPKLEVLKLNHVSESVRNVLLSSSSSLKKLKITMDSPLLGVKCNQDSLNCIRDCLRKNQKLRELELHGSMQYNSFFGADFSDVVRFQLTSLKIKTNMRLALVSEANEEHLIKFLGNQSRFLKNVFIDVCRPNVIEFVFNRMPGLTSIHLDTMIMNDSIMHEMRLELNEKILDLKISYVNDNSVITEFLAVVPNLETLFVSHLRHETIEFIARNLRHLKTLKYRHDDNNCKNFYKKLKDQFPEVNQNIQMIVDYDYL